MFLGERRVVAVGPEQEMAGLASVGIELVPVERGDDLEQALAAQAADPGVRIILLSESVAAGARDLVAGLRRRTEAAILLVPSHRGTEGRAIEWIKHGMEQSIGVDMISRDMVNE